MSRPTPEGAEPPEFVVLLRRLVQRDYGDLFARRQDHHILINVLRMAGYPVDTSTPESTLITDLADQVGNLKCEVFRQARELERARMQLHEYHNSLALLLAEMQRQQDIQDRSTKAMYCTILDELRRLPRTVAAAHGLESIGGGHAVEVGRGANPRRAQPAARADEAA